MKEILAGTGYSLMIVGIAWAIVLCIEPLIWFVDRRAARLGRVMTRRIVRISKSLTVVLAILLLFEVWRLELRMRFPGLVLILTVTAIGVIPHGRDLMAGILILARRRLRCGVWVRASGVVEGAIVTVGLRTTTVRRIDHGVARVPNSRMLDAFVTPSGMIRQDSISWLLGLAKGTTMGQLCRIRDRIRDHILDSEEIAHPPEASVVVRIDHDDSSASVLVHCFMATAGLTDSLMARKSLVCAIEDIVSGAGAEFALPVRAVYAEALPAGTTLFPRHSVQN